MKKKTGMIYRDPVMSALSEKKEKYVAKVSELNSAFYKGVVSGLDVAMKIVARQKDVPIGNGTSDGAHTFGELYKQRSVMLSVLASLFPDRAWKSKLDHKGEAKANRFIVGFDTPEGQATFHCDIQKHWDRFECPELPQAKPFDGHTSGDAVNRLESLKHGHNGGAQKMSNTYPITIQKTFLVTEEDIDTIMSCALDGGITYWCDKAEVVGDYLGEYASDQIARGGSLCLHDSVEDKWHTMGIVMLLEGIQKAAQFGYFSEYHWFDFDDIHAGQIDADVADIIVQLALFGSVIYG